MGFGFQLIIVKWPFPMAPYSLEQFNELTMLANISVLLVILMVELQAEILMS